MDAKVIPEDEAKEMTEFGGTIKEYVMGDTVHFLVGYFKPGDVLKTHYHIGPEEVYYVIKGKGQVLLGEKWIPIEQGTAVYIPPHLVHTLQNSSKDELVVAFLHAPPEKGTLKIVEPDKE